MARRKFLAQLASLPLLAFGSDAQQAKKSLKIMMKSAWGSDDPTRASFAFIHGLALADAGHEVQIFSHRRGHLPDAQSDFGCRYAGWLASSERDARQGSRQAHPRFFLRRVFPGPWGHGDLSTWSAKFGTPAVFVSLVEWADRIITE